ncbi:MAG: peptidylprolyl isomerase [Anaerolineae bacterium]
MANNVVKDGMVVSLAYRLTADGVEVEEATAEEPLDYLHGYDNIVPGLERELAGKKVGDKLTVTLQPVDAYGEYDEEDIEVIDRSDLPDDLEEGMEVLIEDDAGNIAEAVVKEITKDSVVLDFNLPLAGKTITYDVEVVGVRDADPEELDHGHPHTGYFDDEDDFEYDDDDYDDED